MTNARQAAGPAGQAMMSRAFDSFVPRAVQDALISPGRPLDAADRSFMESRFGHDFGHVRVHVDSRADSSASEIGADAYTWNGNIAFSRGRYGSGRMDRWLLAHELAHVVQQENRSGIGKPQGIAFEDDQAEMEAISIADSVISGSAIPPCSQRSGESIQRHVTHSAQGRIGGAAEYLHGEGAVGRYLFTFRGGWLDRTHVHGHDLQANQVMRGLEARQPTIRVTSGDFSTSYTMHYDQIPAAPSLQENMEMVAVAIMTDHDYRFEANQALSISNNLAQTPFSYEDLASDRVGTEIGLRYRRRARSAGLDPDQGLGGGDTPQARILMAVTREVVIELQPASAWQGVEIYRRFLAIQGCSLQPEFGAPPEGAPGIVVQPPMLPGFGLARSLFQGASDVMQMLPDYMASHPRHLQITPYRDPVLSPVTTPAPFLGVEPPDWAWRAIGLDSNYLGRALQELTR
ncbi:MAG: DUF4157 domain-containing protein [Methanotrichaceae archaeon]|nr:DUF4157 domain-containing protein [Methanotrichaceae archaeon]